MSEQGDHKKIAGVSSDRAVLARAARVRTAAKRVLHSLDQLDYLVRHWLMPVSLEKGIRSLPHKQVWIRSGGLPNTAQAAIGHRLRVEYSVDRSLPLRLVILFKEFEQRNKEADARAGYASAA